MGLAGDLVIEVRIVRDDHAVLLGVVFDSLDLPHVAPLLITSVAVRGSPKIGNGSHSHRGGNEKHRRDASSLPDFRKLVSL